MTTNIYHKFLGLLPDDGMDIGQIMTSAGGVVEVTLLNGGTMKAIGSGTVGSKVYIQNGNVIGAASDLTPVDIIL